MEDDIFCDTFPTSDKPNIKTNNVIYHIFEASEPGLGYNNLTGKFLYRSSRKNDYILIAYHYDASAILAVAVKNREGATLTKASKIINETFENVRIKPNTYVMDNKCLKELKDAIRKEYSGVKLVPPHLHRVSKVERVIQTFKNCLKAGLASVDPNFSVKEWDRLIPQAVLALNLL